MNRKTKVVAAAGGGLLALSMVGGGTFALWSDSAVVAGNSAQAGSLVISANSAALMKINDGDVLAPGENKAVYKYVTSRSDDTTALKDAQLFLQIENVVGTDNGCSSSTEKADEIARGYIQLCDANGGDPYTQQGTGHFADQAFLQVRMGAVASADACNASASTSPVTDKTLAQWQATGELDTGRELDPGEGVCVAFELGLPGGGQSDGNHGIDFASANTDNAVQGDSASFDVRFTLKQQIPNVD
jgi:predicted ribosomally synthesized peptide with SipW-like signal peptide